MQHNITPGGLCLSLGREGPKDNILCEEKCIRITKLNKSEASSVGKKMPTGNNLF
jgi:predicted nucleic acid-binding Zn ribbon protein